MKPGPVPALIFDYAGLDIMREMHHFLGMSLSGQQR